MSEMLASAQRRMVAVWEQHMAAEFATASVDDTMATMTAHPRVNHVPVLTGGSGADQVRHFYATSFIPAQPPGTEVVPFARTVGENRLVDEILFKFTHSIAMPWILPGVAPTGRRVEVAMVVVVEFEGDKVSAERIYWDQATVLAQVGLLDPAGLPIAGVEAARKVVDPDGVPSNALIERAEGGRQG